MPREVYKGSWGGSPQVTNFPSKVTNMFMTWTWLICGVLVMIVPSIQRAMKMRNYQKMYQQWNWQEAQEEYQQEQQEYYQNYQQQQNQGQGDYDYNNYNQQQMRSSFDVNDCRWYQWNCFSYFIDADGEPQPEDGWYPGWFSGWTQTEEQREQMMEDGQTSSSMKFVYFWQLLMFMVILAYGFIVIRQNRIVTGVTVALVAFTNMCFLCMWLLADQSIITDGENVQRTGFYGQFSVLMFITNAWYVIFGLTFSAIFCIRGHMMHDETDATEGNALGKHRQPTDVGDGKSYRPLADHSPTTTRPSITSTTTAKVV
mmetsp:Transcript_22003/g.24600  ORF Transcript_22003/g.24600 Transcript_22003/m.24600 type:complete len:314 (-) Transcript_22003:136-1077(-)